ncbi:hypothetical protein DVH05_025207 [Phytophthora capsici]|nr:hypothetical protein DVH05_025207 [Phytophthora capsici]
MPGPPRFESRKLATLRRAEEDEFCTVVLPAIAMVLAEQESSGSEMVVIRERLNWKSHAERLLLEGEFKQYYFFLVIRGLQ